MHRIYFFLNQLYHFNHSLIKRNDEHAWKSEKNLADCEYLLLMEMLGSRLMLLLFSSKSNSF